MTWQLRSTRIIMVANLMEDGRVSDQILCITYWLRHVSSLEKDKVSSSGQQGLMETGKDCFLPVIYFARLRFDLFGHYNRIELEWG